MVYNAKLHKERLYRDSDMALKLFEYLDQDVKKNNKIILKKFNALYHFSRIKNIKKEVKKCYIRQNKFAIPTDTVIDHCHASGQVRGICHSTCYTKLRYGRVSIFIVPVIVHNFKSYDSHIIFKSLAEINRELDKINIFGIYLEKYILF